MSDPLGSKDSFRSKGLYPVGPAVNQFRKPRNHANVYATARSDRQLAVCPSSDLLSTLIQHPLNQISAVVRGIPCVMIDTGKLRVPHIRADSLQCFDHLARLFN
jgi:hypothetical protein